MHSNPQRHRLPHSRYFTAPFNKDQLPQPLTVLLRRPRSTFYSTFRTPRSSTTTTSSRNAWRVGTHPSLPRINVAIRFSSTTRSCNTPTFVSSSHYSTSRRQDGVTTWRYSTANAAPFNNFAGLPPDSAPAPTFTASVNHRYSITLLHRYDHQQGHPLHNTQQLLTTQHRRPIAPLPPHHCISSVCLSCHQKLHLSTYPPPTFTSRSASIVRAHIPQPATISSTLLEKGCYHYTLPSVGSS